MHLKIPTGNIKSQVRRVRVVHVHPFREVCPILNAVTILFFRITACAKKRQPGYLFNLQNLNNFHAVQSFCLRENTKVRRREIRNRRMVFHHLRDKI